MQTGKKKTTTAVATSDADSVVKVPAPAGSKGKASKKKAVTGSDASPLSSAAAAPATNESDYSVLEHVKLSIDKKKYFERPIASKAELTEIRGKMDEDVKQVKELMTRLEEYLRSRVDSININKKQYELMVPIEYMSLKFTTILSVHPQWVFIKCKVMDLEDIPDKIRHELFERILVSNFELNAVFYSVDPDLSAVWVENDLAVTGLDMNAFEIKFNAIVFGIRYFVDSIALPLNQEMKSTFDATGLYT